MKLDRTGSWERPPEEVAKVMQERRNLEYEGFTLQTWVSVWELDMSGEKLTQKPIEWLIIKKNILCNETGIGVLPEFSYCFTEEIEEVEDIQEMDNEMRIFILQQAGADLTSDVSNLESSIPYEEGDEGLDVMNADEFNAYIDELMGGSADRLTEEGEEDEEQD